MKTNSTSGRSGKSSAPKDQAPKHSLLIALEPRLMYDAALAVTVSDVHDQTQAPEPQDAKPQDAGDSGSEQTPEQAQASSQDLTSASQAAQGGGQQALGEAEAKAGDTSQARLAADQAAAEALDQAKSASSSDTPSTDAASGDGQGSSPPSAPLTSGQAGQGQDQAAQPTSHQTAPVSQAASGAQTGTQAGAQTGADQASGASGLLSGADAGSGAGSSQGGAAGSGQGSQAASSASSGSTSGGERGQYEPTGYTVSDDSGSSSSDSDAAATTARDGDATKPDDAQSTQKDQAATASGQDDEDSQDKTLVDTGDEPSGRTVVVIDARVQNHQELAAGVSPDALLVVVEAHEDGLAKVSEALKDAGPVGSVQLFTHADPGDLSLGDDVINAATIAGEHAATLSSWTQFLTEDADILIFGCRAGQGEEGKALIGSFAELTKADVAASSDDTGHASGGGDWALEVSTGAIAARIAIDAEVLDAYAGILTSAPAIANIGQIVIQPAQATAVVMAPLVTLSDAEIGAGSWNGGSLSVVRQGGANAQDVFSATGTLAALTQGSSLTVNGNAIGSVTTNSSGTLTLSFNANATTSLVNEALRQIAYRNSSATPPDLVTLNWTASDGSNNSTAQANVLVNHGTQNDPPVFVGLGNSVTTGEQTAVVLAPSVQVADAELSRLNSGAGNWSGATLSLDRAGTDSAQDTFAGSGQLSTLTQGQSFSVNGTAIGTVTQNSAGRLALSFNSSATNDLVQTAMRSITYTNTADAPPASVTINWTMTDGNTGSQGTGGGGTGTAATTVNITPAGDSPTLGGIATVAATEQTAVQLAPSLTVADPDAPANFNGFTLTLARQGGASSQDAFSGGGTLSALTQGGNVTLSGQNVGTVTQNSGGQLVLTFNANADGNELRDVLRNIRYTNTSDTPPASTSLTWNLADGQGNQATAVNQTVNITAVNDAPSYSGIAAVTVTEQTAASLAPSFAISDPDGLSQSWNTGFVQINRSGGANAQDTFLYNGAAVTAGTTIALSGGNATVAQNSAGTLRITFGSGVTGTDVQSLGRLIGYRNTADAPPASLTLAWSLDDGPGATQTVNQTVTITATPDAPSLGFTSNTVNATEQTSIRLNSAISVSDPDGTPANWNGANLTLARQGGASAQDQFTNTTGQNLSALTQGGSLVVGGTTIGTVTQNSSGQLTLTFNANATTARVNDALQDVSYINSSDAPPSQVTLRWTLTDASGQPGTADTVVNIAAVNDAPTYSGIAAVTVTEQTAASLAPSFAISDPDGLSQTWNTGFVQINRSGAANAQDTFLYNGTAVTAGTTIALSGGNATVAQNSAGTLRITFGTGVTGQDVQDLGRLIHYRNTADAPPASVTLAWSLDDGPGATQTVNQTVTITATPDAPSLGFTSNTVNATEQTSIRLNSAISVSDPDGTPANWNGANLTLARQGGASAQDQFTNTTGQNLSALTQGGSLVVGGTTIGTVTQNSSGQLTLTFNANATTALVNDALQDVSYTNSSDAPPSQVTLRWTLTDASGQPGTADTVVNIAAVNDAPSYSGVGAVTVTEQTAGLLAPAFAISDPDGLSQTWSGGFVEIARQGGAASDDGFQLGGVNLNAGDTIALTGGTATVSQGPTGTLRIDFGAGVTGSDVQGLVRQLQYRNASDTPPASVTLAWSLDDGPGATQTLAQTVNVTPVNDAPSYSGLAAVTAVEQTWATLAPAFAITDPDGLSQSWTGGFLQIVRQGGADAQDVFGAQNTAFAQGSTVNFTSGGTATVTQASGGTLRVDFGAGVTGSDVRLFTANLGYRNDSDTPTPSLTLNWTISDGTFSSVLTQSVSVTDTPEPSTGGGGTSDSPAGTGTATTAVAASGETSGVGPAGQTQTAETGFTILTPGQQQTGQDFRTAALANVPGAAGEAQTPDSAQTGTAAAAAGGTGPAFGAGQTAPVLGAVQTGPGLAAGPALLIFPEGQGPASGQGEAAAAGGQTYILPASLIQTLLAGGGQPTLTDATGAPLEARLTVTSQGLAVTLAEPLAASTAVALATAGGVLGQPQMQVWLLVQPLPGAEGPQPQAVKMSAGVDQTSKVGAGLQTGAPGKPAGVKVFSQQPLSDQLAQSGMSGLMQRAKEIAESAAQAAQKPS